MISDILLREEVREVVAEVLLRLVISSSSVRLDCLLYNLFLHATRSKQRRVMQEALRRWGSRLCPRDRYNRDVGRTPVAQTLKPKRLGDWPKAKLSRSKRLNS